MARGIAYRFDAVEVDAFGSMEYAASVGSLYYNGLGRSGRHYSLPAPPQRRTYTQLLLLRIGFLRGLEVVSLERVRCGRCTSGQ